MRSLSRTASLSRLSTTTPATSPRTNPSALLSKALQRPVGDNAVHLDNAMLVNGDRHSWTPPANAPSLSRSPRLWQARCIATSDDEHAVSTATDGPCRPSRYEMRPTAVLCGLPVPE